VIKVLEFHPAILCSSPPPLVTAGVRKCVWPKMLPGTIKSLFRRGQVSALVMRDCMTWQCLTTTHNQQKCQSLSHFMPFPSYSQILVENCKLSFHIFPFYQHLMPPMTDQNFARVFVYKQQEWRLNWADKSLMICGVIWAQCKSNTHRGRQKVTERTATAYATFYDYNTQ